jgi:hypothetical protein
MVDGIINYILNIQIGFNYNTAALIVGCLTFIAVYVYAIKEYDLFIGIGVCWIPSLMIGLLAGMVWPATVCGVLSALVGQNEERKRVKEERIQNRRQSEKIMQDILREKTSTSQTSSIET